MTLQSRLRCVYDWCPRTHGAGAVGVRRCDCGRYRARLSADSQAALIVSLFSLVARPGGLFALANGNGQGPGGRMGAMRKRSRYTDEFRASAVLMLDAAGYPDREGALSQVGKHLSVPLSTLRGWWHGTHNPPPAELRNEKRFDLLEAIQTELADIFPAMKERRQDASYRELTTAAGILIDKLQLLTGKPTWRGEVIDLLRQGVITPDTLTEELGDELARELFDAAGLPADANR